MAKSDIADRRQRLIEQLQELDQQVQRQELNAMTAKVQEHLDEARALLAQIETQDADRKAEEAALKKQIYDERHAKLTLKLAQAQDEYRVAIADGLEHLMKNGVALSEEEKAIIVDPNAPLILRDFVRRKFDEYSARRISAARSALSDAKRALAELRP